jgi:hypothetical protein
MLLEQCQLLENIKRVSGSLVVIEVLDQGISICGIRGRYWILAGVCDVKGKWQIQKKIQDIQIKIRKNLGKSGKTKQKIKIIVFKKIREILTQIRETYINIKSAKSK